MGICLISYSWSPRKHAQSASGRAIHAAALATSRSQSQRFPAGRLPQTEATLCTPSLMYPMGNSSAAQRGSPAPTSRPHRRYGTGGGRCVPRDTFMSGQRAAEFVHLGQVGDARAEALEVGHIELQNARRLAAQCTCRLAERGASGNPRLCSSSVPTCIAILIAGSAAGPVADPVVANSHARNRCANLGWCARVVEEGVLAPLEHRRAHRGQVKRVVQWADEGLRHLHLRANEAVVKDSPEAINHAPEWWQNKRAPKCSREKET
eukprot:scaffold47260_cov28-Tisochrysis_lutea.AAC.1